MDENEAIEKVQQERAEKQNQLEKDFAEHFMEEINRRNLIFHKAHEMDHMNGTVFLDRVSKVFLQSARRKQKTLLRKERRNGRTN